MPPPKRTNSKGITGSSPSVDIEPGGHDREVHGLSTWQTSLFVIGEVAGCGVLALPNAILGTGWAGILLLVYFCVLAGYSGSTLGKCWMILEERYDDCRHNVRNPYQTIGLKAFGINMSRTVNLMLMVTLFGASVVMLLLMAGMLQELFASIWNESICYWQMIVYCFVVPLTWFGTPKDFWGLAIFATLTVMVASILLLVQTLMDVGSHGHVYYPPPEFRGFSLAFGAMLFGYGGACSFPTIQNDMKDRSKFPVAAVTGFVFILLIYCPVAVCGYLVYGNHLEHNLATTVKIGPLRTIAQILLILHLVCAINVVINPLFQELEERLKIHSGFNWKRLVVRTVVMTGSLFVGESIPEFGKVLNLIGGSTNTGLTFICPLVFYWKLTNMKNEAWKIRTVPLHEKVLMVEIIAIGILGGVTSTISAIWDIASPDALSLPCYVATRQPQQS